MARARKPSSAVWVERNEAVRDESAYHAALLRDFYAAMRGDRPE
jgi:hypothetical protein